MARLYRTGPAGGYVDEKVLPYHLDLPNLCLLTVSGQRMRRYNIFYQGQCLPGFTQAEVRENLADLFKANATVLDKLFSGSEQKVKGGLDDGGAKRYASALRKAGAKPIIREVGAPAKSRSDPPSGSRGTTARASGDSALDLSPIGTPILAEHERPSVMPQQIDTRHLSALNPGQYTLPARTAPEPPNVAHLTLSADTSPAGYAALPARKVNTSGLSLAPSGSDLSEFARPQLPTVEPSEYFELLP